MKINISKVRITPNNITEHCAVYTITDEILKWIDYHGLSAKKHDKGYLNIFIESLEYRYNDLFEVDNSFTYFDGFSPNLNKSLHLGHLSNLVYASAISNLCPYLDSVSILNDTDNDINKEKYLEECHDIYKKFNYNVKLGFFSSNMNYVDFETLDGEHYILNDDFKSRYIQPLNIKVFVSQNDGFENCIVVKTPKTNENKVLVKSNGTTTYLNQDLALAKKLHLPILYLTGAEQVSHFDVVREFFPNNRHLAIGLITIDGEKMSSRKGNVTYLKDIMLKYDVNTLKDTFLKYNLTTYKENVKIEQGLSKFIQNGDFIMFENKKLYLVYLTAQNSYNPSLLYNLLKNESINDINFGLKLLGYE